MNAILTLNAGSSSLKAALFEDGVRTRTGRVDRIGALGGESLARLTVHGTGETLLVDQALPVPDHTTATRALFAHLRPDSVTAIGHRVVHGGDRFRTPERITPEVVEALESLVPLAPLHQPQNIAGIRAVASVAPGIPQVACFDTAYHATIPDVERRFGLPGTMFAQGIKRYGFHGLSYEGIARELPALDAEAARGRTVVAHLGQGASMCALRAGVSVATTMGFTALDGLVMGTRCGSLDPGVLLHLLSHGNMDAEAITELLYKRSGLLGVSGISADMRDLLASDADGAKDAVNLFCYRIARELGALVAVLGGIDALVFTGGIGENAPQIRSMVAERCAWLGLAVDAAANRTGSSAIHSADSRLRCYVLKADEEKVIATHTARVLGL
jgi:acetate kinase